MPVGECREESSVHLFDAREARGQEGCRVEHHARLGRGRKPFFAVLVLGLGALRSSAGLSVAPAILRVDVPVLLAVSLAIVLLFGQRSPHYRTGVSLLILYVTYVAFALVRGA